MILMKGVVEMMRLIPVLAATMLVLGMGVGTTNADGMLLPLPEGEASGYLAVRSHHVTVQIRDTHAITRVEQEFYNPYPFPVESRYLFPIPPDAIVSGFQAVVDGESQSVVHQDPSATNAELYAVIVRERDPSLLQYADWESLAFDLDLPAGGSRKMSLEYEEVLAPTGGLFRYRYVLSAERYSALPLEEVSVGVDLSLSSGVGSIYSSSHQVVIDRSGPGQARVSWEATDVRPDQDFELFYASADDGVGVGLLTGERNGQDHFMFLFSPQLEPLQERRLPKDIVFVVDRSGSMSGEKMDQARNALQFILGQLAADDRFSIVGFDDRPTVWSAALQPAEPHELQDARRFVETLYADGSTDIEAALQVGLGILERSESRNVARMLVFLTDGLPTAGITDETHIARLVAETNSRLKARLHVFGVGYDVNTHLLDRLAAENGGSVTYVPPGENLEQVLTSFYSKIADPLLTDLVVEFEGLSVSDLQPRYLPDLFQGSTLLLAGRCQATGDEAVVRVGAWAGDERKEYVYRFNLDEAKDFDFVPRLWATRRVGELLDRVRVDGESPALVEEIRGLGFGYGLVTPYTTRIIYGTAEGAASLDNMDLYGRSGLNEAWGEVTVQARVQNQAYQQAAQADLATGANVVNHGQHSLAQVGAQSVDLSLLQRLDAGDGPITPEWIAANVEPDRTIEFGSRQYFDLAGDPDARPFLQSGTNVLFAYEGKVIAINDSNESAPTQSDTLSPGGSVTRDPARGPWLTGLLVSVVTTMLELVGQLVQP
jgi:Ca-activated chloride channel family protein